MSNEKQLVNCVRHTRGFDQTIFLFKLLMKFFSRNQFSKKFKKKSHKQQFLKLSFLTTTKIDIL